MDGATVVMDLVIQLECAGPCRARRNKLAGLSGILVLLLVSTASSQTGSRFDNGFSNADTTQESSVPEFDNAFQSSPGPAPIKPPTSVHPAMTAGDAADDDRLEEGIDNDVPTNSAGVGGSARALMSILQGAGLMAFPIAACSMLLVMFTLERAISLRRRRVIPKHFVKLFLSELEGGKLKPAEALELCEENDSPISEVFAAAVKKWNRPSVEVEQAVLDAGERVANGLRRYLRLFNGISTVSPLLGLLGTVLGMIEAFNAIAASDAMGKPELLASGISQALLTTAGGLSVAIPAFIVYMYFTSRVDRLIIEIDNLGQKAVFAIGSDAWKPTSKTKKAA